MIIPTTIKRSTARCSFLRRGRISIGVARIVRVE